MVGRRRRERCAAAATARAVRTGQPRRHAAVRTAPPRPVRGRHGGRAGGRRARGRALRPPRAGVARAAPRPGREQQAARRALDREQAARRPLRPAPDRRRRRAAGARAVRPDQARRAPAVRAAGPAGHGAPRRAGPSTSSRPSSGSAPPPAPRPRTDRPARRPHPDDPEYPSGGRWRDDCTRDRDRRAGVGHRQPEHHAVRLRLRGRPGPAPPALRQGHPPPVDRQRPHRLVDRRRPDQPDGHARRGRPHQRHAVVGEDERRREGRGAPAHGGLAVLAVHARRAGRPHLHGQDRADGAQHRQQVLRRDPGHRRGPPRRGVQPLPAREDRARLPAQPQPQVAAGRRDLATAAGT